jgi:hypothetical protein
MVYSKSSGGVIRNVALTSGSVFSSVGRQLSINASGLVAFDGRLKSGDAGVFAGAGGQITTIALASDPRFSTQGLPPMAPSLNDTGTVAFYSATADGGYGLFTWSGGSITTTALSSNSTFNSFYPPISTRMEW